MRNLEFCIGTSLISQISVHFSNIGTFLKSVHFSNIGTSNVHHLQECKQGDIGSLFIAHCPSCVMD